MLRTVSQWLVCIFLQFRAAVLRFGYLAVRNALGCCMFLGPRGEPNDLQEGLQFCEFLVVYDHWICPDYLNVSHNADVHSVLVPWFWYILMRSRRAETYRNHMESPSAAMKIIISKNQQWWQTLQVPPSFNGPFFRRLCLICQEFKELTAVALGHHDLNVID